MGYWIEAWGEWNKDTRTYKAPSSSKGEDMKKSCPSSSLFGGTKNNNHRRGIKNMLIRKKKLKK